MTSRRKIIVGAVGLAALAAVLLTQSAAAQRADLKRGRANPEAFTGLETKSEVSAHDYMIVAANPHAARAGLAMLRKGGSAIDAAIAAELVLGLVEPQSSGLGGGGFLLYWDAGKQRLTAHDGRETAPMAAKSDRFLLPSGKPRRFEDAVFGGLSVGVPGLVRLLSQVHERHGKLAWARLFEPAIRLAEKGFAVSPRLHKLLAARGPHRFARVARNYFFDARGRPHRIGYRLRNPAYARTLRLIAEKGPDAFYKGPVARDIVNTVRNAPRHKGDMTLADLEGYHAKERPPVCVAYRLHRVCGMGPPSSGGPTVGQVLALLAPFDLGQTPLDPKGVHLIVEAEKLAYADRDRYMADPDFVAIPEGLLDPAYIAHRRVLIRPDWAMVRAKPGAPPVKRQGKDRGKDRQRRGGGFGRDNSIAGKGTSHIVVVDGAGNAVSMTATIESGFGSKLMVRGFLLNNELTDFAFRARDAAGRLVANRVEPGKRPRSSMSPTMVFDETGRLHMLTGSPGGSRIILYVLKTLFGHLDWGLGAKAAAALANFGSRNGPFEIDPGGLTKRQRAVLARLGHEVITRRMTSGAHIIIRDAKGMLHGGADPRREGVALGD